jgi:hypothetical protein
VVEEFEDDEEDIPPVAVKGKGNGKNKPTHDEIEVSSDDNQMAAGIEGIMSELDDLG